MHFRSLPTAERRLNHLLRYLLITLCLAVLAPNIILSVATHAASSEAIFAPIATTFVNSNEPDRTFYDLARVKVDAKPEMRGFLLFSVEGVGQSNVSQARLRLHVVEGSTGADLQVFSAGADWSEEAVTWNQQPALGAQVGGLPAADMQDGSWIEIDLGGMITGDGHYSLALLTRAGDRIGFSARQNEQAPQLVLTLESGAQQPAPLTRVPTAVPSAVPEPTPAPTPPAAGEPALAFPGAEGFGTHTPGGRGGRVIYVTTLTDSGPGSLRTALESSGPRIVLFNVAGTITLHDDIKIRNPYLTIAGQSAPGAGVQIRGGMLKIQTHDVIIRYLKMRPGDAVSASSNEARDAISLSGTDGVEVYNIVIDHCSMVWGPDIGGLAILTNAHDITVQYSIIGEGLYYSNHPEAIPPKGHSKGMNITRLSSSYGGQRPTRITMHHNLFTSSDDRMPQIIGAKNVDLVNNVVYNWGKDPATGNPVSLNLINNMFIAGPMTSRLIAWHPNTSAADPELHTGAVFEQGTVTVGFNKVRGDPQSVYTPERFLPYSMRSEQSAQNSYNQVVQDVGANLPVRDSVDQRIISNLTQRTGGFLSSSDLVWPNLTTHAVPVDTDSDGMPDTWEGMQFNTLDRGTAGDFDQDGYTDIEEYLNGSNPKDASH